MSSETIVGGLGQGGVRAMREVVNEDLTALARGGGQPVEPPGQGEHALSGFARRYIGRALSRDHVQEFMNATRHLEQVRPDIADELCDVIRAGIAGREVPEIDVCIGDAYSFGADGDGYRLTLPRDDPDAYCDDPTTPAC